VGNIMKKEGSVDVFNTIPEVMVHCLLIPPRPRLQMCSEGQEMHKEKYIGASGVPRNFVWGREFQQIQLRTEGRENGDMGVIAP
jgi:hypothetical protein